MKLSVIISNRNDVAMLNVTVRSAWEALKAIDCDGEIVIVDNSDPDIFEIVKTLIHPRDFKTGKVKLIRQEFPCFTMARMEAARQAKGEYVFCVDSHMLFGHNIIKDSVAFMDAAPSNVGFGHPPICWGGNPQGMIRYSINTVDGIWGGWKIKDYDEPHRISWKFMPWIARREWYLNILNGYGSIAEKGISFGGAELLQQVKAWLIGYENWAIPTSPGIHLGPYSAAVSAGLHKYRVYRASGNGPLGIGVLMAFYVFCGDAGRLEVEKYRDKLKKQHGLELDDRTWNMAVEYAKEEREWIKDKRVMLFDELMSQKPWEDK